MVVIFSETCLDNIDHMLQEEDIDEDKSCLLILMESFGKDEKRERISTNLNCCK